MLEKIAMVIAEVIEKDYRDQDGYAPGSSTIRDYVMEAGITENVDEYIAIIRKEIRGY